MTGSRPVQDLPDDVLDAWIRTRLTMVGVDLDVLPEDDASAPADVRRVLASARAFLRSTPGAIRSLPLPDDGAPPFLYPAGWIPPRPLPEDG